MVTWLRGDSGTKSSAPPQLLGESEVSELRRLLEVLPVAPLHQPINRSGIGVNLAGTRRATPEVLGGGVGLSAGAAGGTPEGRGDWGAGGRVWSCGAVVDVRWKGDISLPQ